MTAKQSGEVIDIASRYSGLLTHAGEAVAQDASFVRSILEALPAAIYTTMLAGALPTTTKPPPSSGAIGRRSEQASGVAPGNFSRRMGHRWRMMNAQWRSR